MPIMNIQEAKGHLSALVAEAERGGEVVIARAGHPVVKLVPVAPRKRVLGIFSSALSPNSIRESMSPLTSEEIAIWES